MRAAESVNEKESPKSRDEKTESVKVANEQAKNTLQSILKVQKVFGFEISYPKRAPPIGAPKAALTPADAPAAINYLLATSFLNASKLGMGK